MLIDSSGARFVCALADEKGVVRDLTTTVESAASRPATLAPTSAWQPPPQESVRFEVLLTELIPHNLQSITVGTGPGSFIGTRTAISFANGYTAASGIPLYGVNSLAAIAAVQPEPCAVLRDARRGQWYLWTPDEECMACAEAVAVEQLEAKGIKVVGLEWSAPEPPPILSALQAAGLGVTQVDAVPAAGMLALRKTATPQEYVEPVYLRSFL